MMTGNPEPERFDATVRAALDDVSAATHPAPDLADRILANARAGGAPVASLAARRRASRWALPLLAAASVAALAIGGAIGTTLLADDKPAAPGSTAPITPTPSTPSTPISPSASASAGTTTPPASRSGDVPAGAVPTPVPSHFRAVDVYFTDPSHGWALGDGKCAHGAATDCPALIMTTNGGRDWNALTVPAGLVSSFDYASCGTNGDYSGPCVANVFFADARHGYLWSTREFYSTSDGGKTWSGHAHSVSDWGGATQVVVAGDHVARLAFVEPCSASCPAAVQVARLGSADWQTVHPSSTPIQIFGSTLAAHDGDLYLFAAVGMTAEEKSAGILRSTDGGATWSVVTATPCGPDSGSGDALTGSGVVAESGALVAGCYDGASRSFGIRTAAPGSADFSAFRAMPGEGNGNGTTVVHADSRRTMLAERQGGAEPETLYATDDGGHTWSERARVDTDGRPIRFVTGSDGYAVSADSSSLLETHDGGRTWTPAPFG